MLFESINMFFSSFRIAHIFFFLGGMLVMGSFGNVLADPKGFVYGMQQVENDLSLRSFLPTHLDYAYQYQFPEYVSNTYFLLSQNRKYAYTQIDAQAQFSSPELVQALRWDIETLNDISVWKFLEGSSNRDEKLYEYQFLVKEILIASTEQYDTLVRNESRTQSRIQKLETEYKTLQEQFSAQVMSSSFQELKHLRGEIQHIALNIAESQTEHIELQKNKAFFESQIPALQKKLEYSEQYKDAIIKEVLIEESLENTQESPKRCTSALNCLPRSL